MILSKRDKIAVGYITVQDFLFNLIEKHHIASKYRNQLFGQLFAFVQAEYFPGVNPKEAMIVIEEMNVLRAQMRSLISNQIIEDAKTENGGFGIDKLLGGKDAVLTEKVELPKDFNPKEAMDSVLEFYNKDVPELKEEDAIKLIKGTARKTIEFKDMDETELDNLIRERLKVFKRG